MPLGAKLEFEGGGGVLLSGGWGGGGEVSTFFCMEIITVVSFLLYCKLSAIFVLSGPPDHGWKGPIYYGLF